MVEGNNIDTVNIFTLIYCGQLALLISMNRPTCNISLCLKYRDLTSLMLNYDLAEYLILLMQFILI